MSAKEAAEAAQVVVQAVIADSVERKEGLVALLVQGGKIHDLVNSNLTSYKQLVHALAVSDEALRRQLYALGIEPAVAEVEDVRMDHPVGGKDALPPSGTE
jgi:hypothetical protein